MAKKKSARPKSQMKFFNLRLNEEDLSHLRWLVECDSDMQRDMMETSARKSSDDQFLEDWCIARDFVSFNYRLLAAIDRVAPEIAKQGRKAGK